MEQKTHEKIWNFILWFCAIIILISISILAMNKVGFAINTLVLSLALILLILCGYFLLYGTIKHYSREFNGWITITISILIFAFLIFLSFKI